MDPKTTIVSELNKLAKVTDYKSVYLLAQQAFENGFRGLTVNELVGYLINVLPEELVKYEFIYTEASPSIPLTNPGKKASMFAPAGTYSTPSGNLVLTKDFNVIGWDGTKWVKLSEMDVQVSQTEWEDKPYNQGGQVIKDGQIWSAILSTLNTEKPAESSKWLPDLLFAEKSDSIKFSGESITLGPNGSLMEYSNIAPSTDLRIFVNPIYGNFTLKEITFNCVRLGVLKFKVYEKIGGKFNFKKGFEIEGTSLGVSTVKDLSIEFDKGDYIGYSYNSSDGFIGYLTFGGETNPMYVMGNGDPDRQQMAPLSIISALGFGFRFKMDVRTPPLLLGALGTLTVYSTDTAVESTRIFEEPFDSDYVISKVLFNCRRIGTLKFHVFKFINGFFLHKKSFEFEAIQYGVTEITNLSIEIDEGDYIGYQYGAPPIGFVGFAFEDGVNFIDIGNQDPTGNNIIPVGRTTSVNFGFRFTLNLKGKKGPSLKTLDSRLRTLENINPEDPDKSGDKRNFNLSRLLLPNIGTIIHKSFYEESLPAGWVQTGAWVPTLEGIRSPSVGGWGTLVYWNKKVILDEDAVIARIKINDVNSIFSLSRQSPESAGTAIEVNFQTEKLILYSSLSAVGSTPASIIKEIDLGFSAIEGREYVFKIEKVSEFYYGTITDTVSLVSKTIDWDAVGKEENMGMMWNFPALVFRHGSIILLEMSYSSKLPTSPKFLIVGDSIADGDTIRSVPYGGHTKRWAGLLSTSQDYNVSIMARGGETSNDINAKLPIIDTLFNKPQFCIYAIGTNDSDFNVWKNNTEAFIVQMEAEGTEVILTTLFPRAGREVFCTQVSEYITKSGHRYIDWRKAMTVDGLGITRIASLFLSDSLHPNVLGHRKMYDQLRTDLADII